jgi:hypothetical protein
MSPMTPGYSAIDPARPSSLERAMGCPSCGAENRAAAKFCAAPLFVVRPRGRRDGQVLP